MVAKVCRLSNVGREGSMIAWLKCMVILSAIMFVIWFILYIKPDIETEQENDEDGGYENITDEELNERLKIAQRKIAIEQLKKIEKKLEKIK